MNPSIIPNDFLSRVLLGGRTNDQRPISIKIDPAPLTPELDSVMQALIDQIKHDLAREKERL